MTPKRYTSGFLIQVAAGFATRAFDYIPPSYHLNINFLKIVPILSLLKSFVSIVTILLTGERELPLSFINIKCKTISTSSSLLAISSILILPFELSKGAYW